MRFTAIVNGYPANISVRRDATLSDIVKKVCKETGNTGQPVEEWELHDATGVPLPLHHRARTLKDGARLFVNVRSGIGGSSSRSRGTADSGAPATG